MKNPLSRIGFTAILLLLAGSAALAQQSAAEFIARGKEQLDGKSYLAAKASFEEAVRLAPDLAEAYFYRGKVQLDRDVAETDFTKAIALKPDYAEAYFERGLNRDLNNDPKGAMRDYNRAIELKPTYIDPYLTRAVLYLLSGKGVRALADYTKVIELRPDGDSYYMRGNTYGDLGQYARSVKDLTRAIELDPTYYWSYKQRAVAYRHLKQYRLAQADERKAAAIGPPK